jgi:hypothetical protein
LARSEERALKIWQTCRRLTKRTGLNLRKQEAKALGDATRLAVAGVFLKLLACQITAPLTPGNLAGCLIGGRVANQLAGAICRG